MFLKKFVEIVFLIALVGGIFYVWGRVPLPCSTPLEYSIGQFDTRFNISREEFLRDIMAAEKPWEDTLGHQAFQSAPNAAFKINLIFDERQKRTLESKELESSKNLTEKTQAGIVANREKLMGSYTDTKKTYESKLASFQSELQSYNSEVEYWNKKGGASSDEYKKLQNERKKLEDEQNALESLRKQVNALANEINTSSKKVVATVEKYNSQVEDFLTRYSGEHEDFDEGLYTGSEINIYQFEDEAHLKAVLTHELGHTLGLQHVENPLSILYPLMGGRDLAHLTLSNEDKAELQSVCNKGRWDIMKEKLSLLRSKF